MRQIFLCLFACQFIVYPVAGYAQELQFESIEIIDDEFAPSRPPKIDLPEETKAEPPVVVVEPPPKIWEGSLELGANGSAGNTERFRTRIAILAKRKGPRNTLTIDFLHANANENGNDTENKTLLKGRSEWPLDDTPWNLYTYGSAEQDDFQAWDFRFTGGAGLGYLWIKTETKTLATRLGAGFSREMGVPNDDFVPEANLGFDYEHKISERQKVTATVDVFPDVTKPSDYRADVKAAWEILVDPDWNLSLKLGILDRYDSTPQGAKRNDIDYFATLAWAF